MDDLQLHMISNLRPHSATNWRIKIRVTRMWQHMNGNAEIVGMSFIFADALGQRIQASVPAACLQQFENLLIEGETYDVHRFVVMQYPPMKKFICFENDIYIQLNHMTEIFVTEGVEFIPAQVFDFTDLSGLMEATTENKYLIDVVGILQQVGPITEFTNRRNQQQSAIHFRITDLHDSAQVVLHNDLAHNFNTQIQNAVRHPIIVIIASCRVHLDQGEPKLTNFPATRVFINHDHEAVGDLRDALRLANWVHN
ncbi:hypothetical protein DCAR_0520485 [Daucus carota subsp. sativus]|uniref:Replication protein A 70 kDa DNA-binding subunit B/D first OB fold domain-containing protein n=1 Tax=Daucus carota subsp. sativus TaxID=79200 RepID=A0A161XSH8_DAUCS|nr:hypothetical protein DCAR_0520485 [Daucus carota subsp. sativus]